MPRLPIVLLLQKLQLQLLLVLFVSFVLPPSLSIHSYDINMNVYLISRSLFIRSLSIDIIVLITFRLPIRLIVIVPNRCAVAQQYLPFSGPNLYI